MTVDKKLSCEPHFKTVCKNYKNAKYKKYRKVTIIAGVIVSYRVVICYLK